MTKKKVTSTQPATIIDNCTFTGVQWDATAVKAIQTIADSFLQNAKGLTALAEVLKSQNINVEAMLKIG